MKIPITKPYFDAEERENIVKPLDTGWIVQGPYVAEFQDRFAFGLCADLVKIHELADHYETTTK